VRCKQLPICHSVARLRDQNGADFTSSACCVPAEEPRLFALRITIGGGSSGSARVRQVRDISSIVTARG
jgi:hypothetical protein